MNISINKTLISICLILFLGQFIRAESGYNLWLRYTPVSDAALLRQYRNQIPGFTVLGQSLTLEAVRKELKNGLSGILGVPVMEYPVLSAKKGLSVGKASDLQFLPADMKAGLKQLGKEGFLIYNLENKNIIITANEDIGVLYGVFYLLKLLQTEKDISHLNISNTPKLDLRLLNHWDNLDRTVERGYAGFSIWDWHKLPDYIHPRYIDYARANASIGINGTVLTNVNANALVLRDDYLEKVKALADVFRPYGLKVYLTARFSAPVELGGLKTADPQDPKVRQWWVDKVAEIYALIPDFGGFLVKANSEGQPGPQSYNRSHADGANMLEDAVLPFGGVIMWRAFVYSEHKPDDRAMQAYDEFNPLDGTFRENVFIQVKNGAIDFQPREPAHPLFGAMPQTSLMMEFQITQEYLGQGTHLVYLAPMYKEVLDFDMFTKGKGSTVGKIIDGSVEPHKKTGIAGVSNIGNDINWTGHPFGQANWYAFGRLAWDHDLSSEAIAEEWLRMTFSNEKSFVADIKKLMLDSHETCVNYMTPLGLHHIMGAGHHYGPGPWVSDMPRADWTSVYYHKADEKGLGFDRTPDGSGATAQYAAEVAKIFSSLESCPEKYLLWFHHVQWTEKMASGRTLWEELCYRYDDEVNGVKKMRDT